MEETEQPEPTLEQRVAYLEDLMVKMIEALRLTNLAVLKGAEPQQPESSIIGLSAPKKLIVPN